MTKIEKYHLDQMVLSLRMQRKSYLSISKECNTVLTANGIKDTIDLQAVEYFCSGQVRLAGMEPRVQDHIQEMITEVRDGARRIIGRCNRVLDKQETAMNPLDNAHVKAFTDIVTTLQKSLDQLTGVLNTLKPPVQIFNQRVVQIAEIIANDTQLTIQDKHRLLDVIARNIVPITEGDVDERTALTHR